MIPGVAGLLAVGLFSVAGWLMTGFVPSLRSLAGLQRWGYSYLLGVAWICGSLYVFSHLLNTGLGLPAVFGALVPLLVAAFARTGKPLRRAARSGLVRQIRERPLSVGVPCCLAFALGILVSAALLEDALGFPASDWDGRMTWSMQARWIWDEGTVDPSVLREKQWFVSHPQYPLLMPLAQVVALDVFGSADDDRAARPVYAVFFPALLVILYAQARRWLGRRTAFWVVLVVANIPLLAFEGEGGALSSYSNLPLACFYGAAIFLLLARPGLPEGLAAGLLLAAAVLVKNEGLPLALAAVCIGAWTALINFRRHRRISAAVAAAAVVAAAIGFLHSWQSHIPNRQDESYLSNLSVRRAAADLIPHARIAAPLALERMLSRDRWAFFWPLALALGALGFQGLRRPPAARLAAAVAAPMAVGLLAYVAHADPAELVPVTWDRLLLHAVLPGLLLLGFCLRPVLAAVAGCSSPSGDGRRERPGRFQAGQPPGLRHRPFPLLEATVGRSEGEHCGRSGTLNDRG